MGQPRPPPPDETVDTVIQPRLVFDAQSIEARGLEVAASLQSQANRILREFRPDIIHCNDRQTYLPFRFEPNVVYSSHLLFSDLVGLLGMNEEGLQELKTERCAIHRSAAVIVYSEFIQTRIWKSIWTQASPVVVPLGFCPEDYKPNQQLGSLRIAYFGRFEGAQKGIADLTRAVQILGSDWLNRNNVKISLFGRGDFPANVDRALFDEVGFLERDALRAAFGATHIVVMPSRYEPFGLVGLEAMASGCLLIAPQGQGIDEYGIPGETFVPTLTDPRSLAVTLNSVVEHWGELQPMAEKGRRSVQHWNWERSASAHLEIYRSVNHDGGANLSVAHRSEYAKIAEVVPKLLSEFSESDELVAYLEGSAGQGSQTLVLHPFLHDPNKSGESLFFQSLWQNYQGHGPKPRLEQVPCKNRHWDRVLVFAAWETQLDPHRSLSEMIRIARSQITILSWAGARRPWHSLAMGSAQAWSDFLGTESGAWAISIEDKIKSLPNWIEVVLTRKKESEDAIISRGI